MTWSPDAKGTQAKLYVWFFPLDTSIQPFDKLIDVVSAPVA